MRSLILLTAVFISFSAMTKEIEVQDGRRKFLLTITEDQVRYKDELTTLSLTKKDCNSHLITRLQRKIDKFFKRPLLEDSRQEFLKIKVDGKQFFEPRFGDRAVFFLSLPEEVKKLKLEESLNCEKN